ncbi:hypothetical protein VTK56DRAFT_10044 [Thermocarpiscus australiensis]
MSLLPDLGSWLLRSVRRDNFPDSPNLAIQRLKSQPRPLNDADKDALVGAVLTMGASLHLALDMLLESLPHDTSRERLGEVLCPTLGQLLASLQGTLSSLKQGALHKAVAVAHDATGQPPGPAQNNATGDAHLSADKKPSEQASAVTERFPPLEASGGVVSCCQVRRVCGGSQGATLAKALQAELRVQAAIHVAVESLEFAEGQLKLVKELNQIHGGSFDILQRHFYEGYNRLLFRALELEQREFGLLPEDSHMMSSAPPNHPQQGEMSRPSSKQHQSVSFQNTLKAPSMDSPPRTTIPRASFSDRRPLTRRNTILGIRQEDTQKAWARPPVKRRLSLAEELAMVGEDDSESGYQEETSGTASSGSEESDVESGSGPLRMGGNEVASEEYSTTGESAREESGSDGDESEDSGERTIDALGAIRRDAGATTSNSRPQSRLPRFKPRA